MTHLKLRSLIASPSDRDTLVYEIWLGETQIAEIIRVTKEALQLEIYNNSEGSGWIVDAGEITELLKDAAEKL